MWRRKAAIALIGNLLLGAAVSGPAEGAATSGVGFSYTFTVNGVSNTVNWNNSGLGDFNIVDGSVSGAGSGQDAFDNGAWIDVCNASGCAYATGAYTTYTGTGSAASSTLYQGATVTNIVSGLNATVSYKFSQTTAAARILVQLDNTTSSAMTRTVRLRNGLGCDGGCFLKYQSANGSTLANYYVSSPYTTNSYWTITSDNSGTLSTGSGTDPIVSYAYGTAGAAASPTTTITSSAGDNLFTTIDATIPAKSTRYLVFTLGFAGITTTANTLGDAYNGVNTWFTSWNSLPSDIKSDLTGTQLSQILNWIIPPSVSSFSTSLGSPTNTVSDINYLMSMSQSVTGLTASDFTNAGTASGCTFTPDTSTGTSFTITASGCGEGTLIPQLTANSVTGIQIGPGSNSPATNTIVIDRTAPTISSVATTNGNYQATSNANMNFSVVFSESVTVSGSPRLPLTIGSTSRFATFISMTDSKTAIFRYTVTVDYNDIDLDGISVLSALDTNSAIISDLASNAMSSFTFTPPTTTSVNVFQPPSAPTIDSITANNTSLSINFTAGASNGSVISNYKYSLNGGAFTALSPVDSTTPLVLTGLTNGTTYSIQIKAVSNLGDGLASNIVSQAPTASARLSIFLTASATTAVKGTLITITANISQAGVVTFFWNDKRISGCIKKSATTAATCQWKPNVTGQWSVQALLDPTDPTYVDSYSPKLPVFILSRSGNR